MNKKELTGALAYQGIPGDIIHDAARLVERLLPGVEWWCSEHDAVADVEFGGRRHCWVSQKPMQADTEKCQPVERQVWDEGIVEAVAKALYESWINGLSKTPWLLLTKAEKVFWFQNARAVLSAIAELLTEKVEK